MSEEIRISDAIWQRCRQIANTGTYEQAINVMCDAFVSSKALADWFDCPDNTSHDSVRKYATQAVLHCRMLKRDNAQRTDPWPAGKINTEFGMFCTGKSKEEIEKMYLEFSKIKKA